MRCWKCGADNPDDHSFCRLCGHHLEWCDDPFHARDVIATLTTSQDQVTWLAFSLAMTVETLLGIAYVGDIEVKEGRLLISLAGAFLALVFFLLVMRSTYDMRILARKGENAFPYAFHLPEEKRFGIRIETRQGMKRTPSAGQVMRITLAAWMLAWIAAILSELLFPAG